MAKRRAQVDQRDDSNQEFFRRLFGLAILKPLHQLQEYVSVVRRVDDREALALKIRRDRLGAVELAKVMTISMVVAGILAELLKVEIKINFGIPLLDPILAGLLLVVGYVLGAVLVHWHLRLFGGKASFRQTFITTAFISAAAYPLVVLAVGGMMYFGADENRAWQSAQIAPMGLLAAVLGPVHGISGRRAVVVLGVSSIVLLAVGSIIIITVFNAIG